MTEEHKRKISEALKGRVRPKEWCQKISEGRRGIIPWSKGKKGLWSNSLKGKKRPQYYGDGNPNWKGGLPVCKICGKKTKDSKSTICRDCYLKNNQSTNYKALHAFVYRNLGRPEKCSFCGVAGKKNNSKWSIHWANKSGEYKRDLNDWIALCVACHKKYDKR